MNSKKNLFYKKKILIYGFGKSGSASFKYLNQKNICKIIDDNKKNIPFKLKKKTINYGKLRQNYFDYIILSPGININKCKLSTYLKKNKSKIITDLDVFYLNNPYIKKIAITGTNGKSTTSKLLFDVLKSHKFDVRLTGNIGYPILMEQGLSDILYNQDMSINDHIEYQKKHFSKIATVAHMNLLFCQILQKYQDIKYMMKETRKNTGNYLKVPKTC